jgi:hypothetical protein
LTIHLLEPLRRDWSVQRLAWFSKGCYRVSEAAVGTCVAAGSVSTVGQLLGLVDTAEAAERPPASALPRLWQRIWDEDAVLGFVPPSVSAGAIRKSQNDRVGSDLPADSVRVPVR